MVWEVLMLATLYIDKHPLNEYVYFMILRSSITVLVTTYIRFHDLSVQRSIVQNAEERADIALSITFTAIPQRTLAVFCPKHAWFLLYYSLPATNSPKTLQPPEAGLRCEVASHSTQPSTYSVSLLYYRDTLHYICECSIEMCALIISCPKSAMCCCSATIKFMLYMHNAFSYCSDSIACEKRKLVAFPNTKNGAQGKDQVLGLSDHQ